MTNIKVRTATGWEEVSTAVAIPEENVVVSTTEPVDAPDGTVWFDTDEDPSNLVDIEQVVTTAIDNNSTISDHETRIKRVDPGIAGDVARGIRWDQAGVPLVGKFKEAFINDYNDIDPTGVDPMGATINTYLLELRNQKYTQVYFEGGSEYKIETTVDVPNGMALVGPARRNQGDENPTYKHNHRAMFRAGADNLTMVKLNWYSRVLGMYFHGGLRPGYVGLVPESHTEVADTLFGGCAADGYSIRSGGIMYFYMHDNMFSDIHYGVPLSLTEAGSIAPFNTYFGVNVGVIERNVFFAQKGIVLEGIYTLRGNNFEGNITNIAVDLPNDGATTTQYGVLEDNYFEMGSSAEVVGQAIHVGPYSSVSISGTHVYGPNVGAPWRPGSYGIKMDYPQWSYNLTGNKITRVETGIEVPIVLSSGVVEGNDVAAHIPSPYVFPNTRKHITDVAGPLHLSGRTEGHVFASGSVRHGVDYYEDGYGPVINLLTASGFYLDFATPTTITTSNRKPGMRFYLHFATGNTTIANAHWHLKSGVDETPAAGTIKDFIVDYLGVVREI